MDGGKVAEFDTVLNLFDKEDSIFRSLCDEAQLTRNDIQRIRADHGVLIGTEDKSAVNVPAGSGTT
jgi:hypothetical protein